MQKRRSTSKLNDACLLRVFPFFLSPPPLFFTLLSFVNYLNNVTRRNQASKPPLKSYFFKDCIWLNSEFEIQCMHSGTSIFEISKFVEACNLKGKLKSPTTKNMMRQSWIRGNEWNFIRYSIVLWLKTPLKVDAESISV